VSKKFSTIHVYFGVNLERVWSVIENDLDNLISILEGMKNELQNQAAESAAGQE